MLLVSLIILGYIGLYSLVNRKIPGAIFLFIQMLGGIIWSLASFLEINTIGLYNKIIWRNMQQIGVFTVPIASVFFAIAYSKQYSFKKYAYVLTLFPVLDIVLIYTNYYHHLVRSGYVLAENAVFGQNLIVKLTTFGSILVAINFFIPLLSMAILFKYRRKVSDKFKKQVSLVILSIFFMLIFSWAKTAVLEKLGLYIPIAVLYIPSTLIMFYCLFKYNLLNVSPIARDKVFDVIKEGIIVIDEASYIVDANEYAKDLTSKYITEEENLLGLKVTDVLKDHPQILELYSSKNEAYVELKYKLNAMDNYLSCSVHLLYSKEAIIGAILILNDITEKKLYEISLKEKADRDSLTGLLNRRGFTDKFNYIEEQMSTSLISITMIDIDYFKSINDTYGHMAGDKVLMHFSELLNKYLDTAYALGRIGGEEFAVLFNGISKKDAFNLLENFRKEVESSAVVIDDNTVINYTISIGITDNNTKATNLDELIRKADIALYEAKESSRNCTKIYEGV
jgi:diguanylate cyclase (GGDEF)-like protein